MVAHDSARELRVSLASIGDEWPVTVVDVASRDGSAELVERQFPTVSVLRLDENVGFGTAANIGAEATESSFILLLNADAWPIADAIAKLTAAALEDPRVAILAPRLRNPDGSPQRSVFGYPRDAAALAVWAACPGLVSRAYALRQRLPPVRRRPLGTRAVVVSSPQFPVGAALLLRRSAFIEAGGFDEGFFMYSEETDLCERVRQNGWVVATSSNAVFEHVGAASTSRVSAAMYREQLRSYLRFLAKYESLEQAESARRLLARALRLRAALDPASAKLELAETAAWIGASQLAALIRQGEAPL